MDLVYSCVGLFFIFALSTVGLIICLLLDVLYLLSSFNGFRLFAFLLFVFSYTCNHIQILTSPFLL